MLLGANYHWLVRRGPYQIEDDTRIDKHSRPVV
jgi:hypothetical protein